MTNNPVFFASFAVMLTIPISACTRESSHELVVTGSPMSESIRFEFAVFYLPAPSKDPVLTVRQEASVVANELSFVAKIPTGPTSPQVRVRLEKDVKNNYRPPDLRSLQYFGHGLSREQSQTLQDSSQALILEFAHPKKNVWDALRAANELVEKTARQTNGLIWDNETREIFTPDEWRVRRIDSWRAGMPMVAKQTVIHVYKNTEFVRAITLGMIKMGLPDVVVEDFPWSSNRPVGNLINDFCQSMAEGASFGPNGEFELDIKALRHPVARDAELQSMKASATAVARLTLERGIPEDGDPTNRLVRLTAERYPGADSHAKQEKMISSVFGSDDSVSRVKHTDVLVAASEKARGKLPTLRRAFKKGLQPGEFILLKAPFATAKGGTEWMWVEVTSWNNTSIRGLLQNDPFDIPTLHAGQMVEVEQGKVFDYVLQLPNGTREGNETGKIILEMETQRKKQQ